MLKITEIFHSVQGESTWAGLPCTFVRLTGCPLRCHYCDTEYAFRGGEYLGLDAIAARPDFTNEDWQILVTSDHGHKPNGGHGGQSEHLGYHNKC